MKAEHRHELKTNELAEWIANFPKWVKDNLRTIIYVSAVVIIVAGAFIWKSYKKNVVAVQTQIRLTNLLTRLWQSKPQILQSQLQGGDMAHMLIPPAKDLEKFAQAEKNQRMSALALIESAEALRAELHYRKIDASKQELAAQIALAKKSYTAAAAESADFPQFLATTRFGLGLCEEELGKFELAKQIYQEVADNPDFEGTVAAVQAKNRLEVVDSFRKKIVFKPAPKPIPQFTSQPQNISQPPIPLRPIKVNVAGVNVPQIDLSQIDLNDISLPRP